MRQREILKVISTGWPHLTCLLTFRALEISVRRLTTVDSGTPAESKQEARTSVGASSSGTAFSRGGNSCYAHAHVHGRGLIRSGRAASRPWSGLTSITCFKRATIGCLVRAASSACRMESIVTWASALFQTRLWCVAPGTTRTPLTELFMELGPD
jgi:hypothetical protein